MRMYLSSLISARTNKMRSFNLYKSAALVLAFAFCACTELEDMQSGVGYLEFPVLSVDTAVEDMAQTKVTPEGFTFTAPDLSKVAVSIIKEGETAVFKTISATETLTTLPVGKYTLEASYSTNTFGEPYLVGRSAVTISDNVTTPAAIEMALANSLVRVKVASSLANDFTGESVAFSAVVEGQEHTGSAACGEWAYVPSGIDVTVRLKGVNSVGKEATFVHRLAAPAAKTAYEVICEKDANDWPTITLPAQQDGAWANRLYITPGAESNNAGIPLENLVYQVSESSSDWSSAVSPALIDGYHVVDGLVNGKTYYVRGYVGNIYSEPVAVTISDKVLPSGPVSVSHDYPGGILTGSIASVDLGLSGAKGILKELYEKGLLVVENVAMKRGGETLRTFASASAVEASAAEDWPYLPQSYRYSVSFTHRLQSEASAVPSEISDVSFSAEPVFAVALGPSYTSYDLGTGFNGFTKDADAANELDAGTLYDVSASCSGISSDLLGNPNYESSLKVYFDGAEKKSVSKAASCSVGNITSLAWKEHSLKATMVFDGVTKTAEKVHHITGLPYRAVPPKNSGSNAWKNGDGNINWTESGDYVKLSAKWSGFSYKAPYITSPTFHIPGEIKVSVSSKVIMKAHVTTGVFGRTYDTTYSISFGGTELTSQRYDKNEEKEFTPSAKETLSSSGTLKCASSCSTNANPWVKIKSVNLLYN